MWWRSMKQKLLEWKEQEIKWDFGGYWTEVGNRGRALRDLIFAIEMYGYNPVLVTASDVNQVIQADEDLHTVFKEESFFSTPTVTA